MVNNKIQVAEENLIHVYNRFPVVLDHGKVCISMMRTERNIWILPRGLR